MDEQKKKWDLGGFDDVVAINKKIEVAETKEAQEVKATPKANLIKDMSTQEIDLSQFKIKSKKINKSKMSISLKATTEDRVRKIALQQETTISEVIEQILRGVLGLKD